APRTAAGSGDHATPPRSSAERCPSGSWSRSCDTSCPFGLDRDAARYEVGRYPGPCRPRYAHPMDGGGSVGGRMPLVVWGAIAALSVAAIILALIASDQTGLPFTILACISAAAAFGPIGALIVRRRGNA